jgi:thiamine pyrophosphate-dependent acetolactate synthase large subunit-like protein
MYSSSRRRFVRNLSLAVSAVPLVGKPFETNGAAAGGSGGEKDGSGREEGHSGGEEQAAAPADTTADIIVDKLIAWDVQFVFGLTGDGIIPLVEALRKKQDKIRYITVRHEETAAFMASGYAKYTGRLGVCLATTGPGAVHLLNGLYDAAMEGAPVLAITGIINHDLLGTQFTQEVDTVKMLQDVAIYNQTITGAQHALTVVDLACRNALTVPGVAHITISTDTQMKPLDEDKASKKAGHLTGSSAYLPRRDVPEEQELRAAATLLNKPGKIMILAGRGALDARAELIQLADKLGAPVAKALLGKSVLPDDSPYTTGGTGRLGTIPSKQMMEECDTLLILGSTMPHLEYYPKTATGIQIDRDARRIGLRYPVTMGLHGDVRATLKALLPMLNRHSDRSFLELAQGRMKTWRATLSSLENAQARPIHPAFLAATVGRLLADDAVVSIDTGAHTVFTARHWPIRPDQQLAVCGNLASMAPGLPYALAASLAYPKRQCVAMVGDGSLTMLMGELATAVMFGLNVKVIVFKNDILAMDKFEQEEAGAQDYGVKLQPIDFVQVAQACGAEGYACKEPGQLEAVIRRALASPRAALVEVAVDPNAEPFPPEKIPVSHL